MKTELESILKIKLEDKDGKLYYCGYLYLRGTSISSLPDNLTIGGYLGLEGTSISDTSKVNTNIPNVFLWRNRKYIKADSQFSEIISQKGNIYRIRQIGERAIGYLITDENGRWSHGATYKEAKEDLIYKIGNRDKSKYENLTVDSIVSFEESIEMYRVITGACSFGTRNFIENRLENKKSEYTIGEIIELTKGEYQWSVFDDFFKK